ncbi:MAG: chorismate mutase [Alphaproteobacteria bacterium]|nr:chorismate mutase [Alphaproteobacteria bacterium]
MSAAPSNLAYLRDHVDAIDDRMHDLLMERAELIARIAASKTGEGVAFYQPAREAQILRRLAARHHGALPVATVIRIWREMLAATVRIETDFAIAVFAPSQAQHFWDLARDHYGSHAPIFAYYSIGQVIGAVSEGRAAVGILPMPEEGDANPWWRHLASHNDDAPRVLARLPFGPRGNARDNGADALVIGRGAQQLTGADRTLFLTEAAVDLSRAQFLGSLSSAGLRCTFLASWEHAEGTLNLIEIDGFVPISDPRVCSFHAQLGGALCRLLPFGGYALPLPPEASSPGASKG